MSGGDIRGFDVCYRLRLDVTPQCCLHDFSQRAPLSAGEPPQFLLGLNVHLNDHTSKNRSFNGSFASKIGLSGNPGMTLNSPNGNGWHLFLLFLVDGARR